ncbi:MAG: DUF1592 domain-containing protein [Lentisphaerales bacterium]|nr:DUF1592 domain-containing protein [Lentisphaerales bacterium]
MRVMLKIKSLELFMCAALSFSFIAPAETSLQISKYDFKKDIMPIFEKYCTDCHGPKKKKGGVRITDLDPDFVKGEDGDKWYGILDVINLGEMPPEDEPQPTDAERRKIIDWLTVELNYASQIKSSDVKTIIRRLNKQQYTNTLKELLGVNINFGKDLPNDGLSHEGFTNNGETLTMSTLHMEYYMKIARKALDKAIVTGDAPEIYRFKTSLGKGISQEKGKVGLGYQSVPIQKSDYLLETLPPEGKSFKARQHSFKTKFAFNNSAGTKGDIESSKSLYDTFYVDMRGSNKKRFTMLDEGIILQSSLPHVEKAAKIWQGPAPNMKVIMRDFPKEGDFRITVEASKAPFITEAPKYLDLEDAKPAANFDSKTQKISAIPGSKIIDARKPAKYKGLNLNTYFVHTKKTPTEASYSIKIKPGVYQLDIVYAAQDSRPLDIKVNKITVKDCMTTKTGSWSKLKIFSQAVLRIENSLCSISFKSKGAIPHIHAFILSPVNSGSKLEKKFEQTIKGKNPQLAKYHPYIRVFAGNRLDDGMEYRTFDKPQKVTALFGQAQKLYFHGRLEDMPLPVIDKNDTTFLANMALFGIWNDSFVTSAKKQGEPVLIKSIEFEGPYFKNWPPKSHTNIFFESKNSSNKEIYTREILEQFISKAFRRKAKAQEIDRLMSFWKRNHKDFNSYEESVKELLVAVLCSPHFLYIAEPEESNEQKTLDDYQLASRLSYFLWNTMPDSRLLELAQKAELKKHLTSETKRMLQDPKAFNFSEAYSDQWLDIQRLDNIGINISMYPTFTRYVKEDMAKETHHFFHEVLTKNMSVMNFIDSDFVMINQNLAQFYNIPDIKGSEFRKVAVPRSKQRGGLLSQGSFLTGHSSGEDSHPIKRGVWLIEKITDNPPPEPPPNVPVPDPEDPEFAKLTKKQQLEKHRDNASCRDCHRKIDPWGVPFEQYDAIGQLRDKIITKRRKTMPVDANSTLNNGTDIKGISGLKKYLLENEQDNVNRGVTKHLLAYALGRSLSFTDDSELNKILDKSKASGYKMHSIIEGIVTSKLFTQR